MLPAQVRELLVAGGGPDAQVLQPGAVDGEAPAAAQEDIGVAAVGSNYGRSTVVGLELVERSGASAEQSYFHLTRDRRLRYLRPSRGPD